MHTHKQIDCAMLLLWRRWSPILLLPSPLLLQGLLQRTPRGRVATSHAWQHFGLAMPAGRTPELWDPRGE